MQGCNITSALMNSAAGDSCYFVMTVVGHGLIFFFFFVGGVLERKKTEAEGRFMHG